MPERPQPKIRPHPWENAASGIVGSTTPTVRASSSQVRYAELQVTSNFSFLRGASHPEELVEQAANLGHHAIAVTDVNSLAGIVRAHLAATECGMKFITGCRLSLRHWWADHVLATRETQSSDAGRHIERDVRVEPNLAPSNVEALSVLVYPTTRQAYGRLCRLLTLGKRRAPKGECYLTLHDLINHHEDLLAVVAPPETLDQDFIEAVRGLQSVFDDDRLSLAVSCLYGPDDHDRLTQLGALSEYVGIPMAATNNVHYHTPYRRMLQDVLTCIRHGCTLPEAGLRLSANAERHLKSPQEMARLCADYPHAVDRTIDIAERAGAFKLDQLRYQYPNEACPSHQTPMQYLVELTWRGARERYPQGIPDKVRHQIEHEFALIDELKYAPYFLTVYDIMMFAKSRDILCQGRGAAANSAVCYCLGVTAVDPGRIDLLFERFVSRERDEPPDIDIDFEHERREEVIQYIYRKYGRDHAALTAEVISYRGRSAVREVGKALGVSVDGIERLSKSMDWWDKGKLRADRVREIGLNPDDPTVHHLAETVNEILGFPRHLSQHVGGFVITRDPLCELVPIENAAMEDRTVIEWDKDDIDAMGMLKVDVLGLGMLTCIRKSFELVGEKREEPQARKCEGVSQTTASSRLSLHTIPPEDPLVYDMVCAADTIGVFQIESRAQMSMLPRLRPRCFYDLVIEVAIVRPGPIQGKMVHPYLRRRRGLEPVAYPSEDVKDVLGKTLGVPLFQEQAMRLAIVAAGFTPDEADQLRRAMAAWKRKGNQIEQFGRRLIAGMAERGYPREFAERCFEQIKGFSDYGFPESHAASFALLVYVSSWLKKYYPAAFAAALINSQPMGFYAPAQIVRDAREHDVQVLPVDVHFSAWDCVLEEPPEPSQHAGNSSPAVRLGMRLIKGLREDEAQQIVQAVRRHGRFDTIERLWRASGVRVATLRRLAGADAFTSMGLDRQQALWEIRTLRDDPLPLFDRDNAAEGTKGPREKGILDPSVPQSPRIVLPAIPEPRKVVQDYASIGLSLKAHPMSFLRATLNDQGVDTGRQINDEARSPHGRPVAVAGVVLVRQRPATASGIVFITIEDETGIANLIIRPQIYERYRPAARYGVVVLARGTVEREGEVVHVLVQSIHNVDWAADALAAKTRDFH